MTDLGPLDCLGAIEGAQDYDLLVPLSVEVELDGRAMRVLGLETIVAIKQASQNQKDRLALPVLEARCAGFQSAGSRPNAQFDEGACLRQLFRVPRLARQHNETVHRIGSRSVLRLDGSTGGHTITSCPPAASASG